MESSYFLFFIELLKLVFDNEKLFGKEEKKKLQKWKVFTSISSAEDGKVDNRRKI